MYNILRVLYYFVKSKEIKRTNNILISMLTCDKHLHDRIMSLREEICWTQWTSLTPPCICSNG